MILLAVMFLYMYKTMSSYNLALFENSYFAKQEIVISSILTSPYCLAYTDKDTNRVYPGIIDKSRFTGYIINSCLKYTNFTFNLKLQDTSIASNKNLKVFQKLLQCLLRKSNL